MANNFNNNYNNRNNPNIIKSENNSKLISPLDKTVIDENEEIIINIQNGNLFGNFKEFFSSRLKQKDSFENKIKNLKLCYQRFGEEQEKKLQSIKEKLEKYFKNKVQSAKTKEMEYKNSEVPQKLPSSNIKIINDLKPLSIMDVTVEHDQILHNLRKLYEDKVKNAETVYIIKLNLYRDSIKSYVN